MVRYSDDSRECTASIFTVTEMVHVYAADIWEKSCDACTKSLGVIGQPQVVVEGEGDMTGHNLWQCCPQESFTMLWPWGMPEPVRGHYCLIST